jgi:hypothetical protein
MPWVVIQHKIHKIRKNKIFSGSININIKMSLNLSFTDSGTDSIPPSAKNYVYNGYTMNNSGYLANPSRSAQVAANNAGALTRAEASRMGLPLGGRK